MSSNVVSTPLDECQSCWASTLRAMRPWRHNLCTLRLVRCKTIDLFSTTSLESQESYSIELFSVLLHGSKTLPPRQPRVFARLAIMLPPRQTSPSLRATIGPSAKQSTSYSLRHWNLKQSISYSLRPWHHHLCPLRLVRRQNNRPFIPYVIGISNNRPLIPYGLDITISANYDWSVGKTIDLLFPTSLESQESYLITGMLPYKHSRSFPQYARLYNAAASPASRLRSAGLVGNQAASLLELAP